MSKRLTREQVYKLVDGERDYQDEHTDWDHQGVPSFEAELLLMEEYIRKARSEWVTSYNNDNSLNVIRKVIGIAVRAFENHGGTHLSRKDFENQNNYIRKEERVVNDNSGSFTIPSSPS